VLQVGPDALGRDHPHLFAAVVVLDNHELLAFPLDDLALFGMRVDVRGKLGTVRLATLFP